VRIGRQLLIICNPNLHNPFCSVKYRILLSALFLRMGMSVLGMRIQVKEMGGGVRGVLYLNMAQ
jgi:hypothetical protein